MAGLAQRRRCPAAGVVAVLVLAAALTLWSERTLLGKEAGITLLVVLMSLKTLELRARRDALVVFFLGFFLVLTHFLYSQSLATALWLLVSVWGLLTALVLAHMPVGRRRCGAPARWRRARQLLGVPVMVAMFVLFPRIGPLWGLPQDAAGRTGLSGSLRLGGVASVAEDESIAMRVRFEGPAPDPGTLYFRGPVLSSFDGREWTPGAQLSGRRKAAAGTGVARCAAALRADAGTQPPAAAAAAGDHTRRAAAAPRIEGWQLTLRPDAQWQVDRPITERVRVQRHGLARGAPRPTPARGGLRDLVDLPPGGNPRTLQWAAQLRQQPALARRRPAHAGRAVLAHIRSGGFIYTLEPGPYTGRRHRRVLARPQAGLLRALCQRLRGRDAGHGRAGAPGHRLPGGRRRAAGRLVRGAPEQRPRLGRDLAARRRLAAHRPHIRRGARPHPRGRACAPAGPGGRRDGRHRPGAGAQLRGAWET
jgi:hypothetical protein